MTGTMTTDQVWPNRAGIRSYPRLVFLSVTTKSRHMVYPRQRCQKCLLAVLSVTTKSRHDDLPSVVALEMPMELASYNTTVRT
jgi:hypothetical protein